METMPSCRCVWLVKVKSNAAFISQVKIRDLSVVEMSIKVRGILTESRIMSVLRPQDTGI